MKTDYIETKPLITIRSKLPKGILNFIKKLKRKNRGSRWINEAIIEKFNREEIKKK